MAIALETPVPVAAAEEADVEAEAFYQTLVVVAQTCDHHLLFYVYDVYNIKMQNKICDYIKHTKGNYCFFEIHSPVSIKNTTAIQFNVGSSNDSVPGITHLIEHLITRPNSEQNRNLSLESGGIKMNAYTYKDRVIFFASSYISDTVQLAVKLIESFNWNFTEKDLHIEKNTICSEIIENKGNLNKKIFNLIIKNCVSHKIAGKEFEHDITGSSSTIRKINLSALKSFVENNFFNPTLAITSTNKLTEKEVDLIFNSLEKAFLINKKAKSVIKSVKKGKSMSIDFSVKNTQVKGFAFNSKDQKRNFIYLGLLKQYLGGDWSSIANQKMRVDKQLTYFVYSGVGVYKDFSYVYIQYDAQNSSKKQAADEVKKIFFDLKKGNIDSQIFEASKKMRVSNVFETFKNEYDILDDFLASNTCDSPSIYTLEEYLEDVKNTKIEDFALFIKENLPN